jgi:hypothetical protein
MWVAAMNSNGLCCRGVLHCSMQRGMAVEWVDVMQWLRENWLCQWAIHIGSLGVSLPIQVSSQYRYDLLGAFSERLVDTSKNASNAATTPAPNGQFGYCLFSILVQELLSGFADTRIGREAPRRLPA